MIVSAPTIWEEGHLSGDRVTRLAALACVLAAVLDVAITRNLSALFDFAFVLICVGMAIGVRPSDFFRIGVLPPILLVVVCSVLAIVMRSAVADKGDGFIQAVVAGLAHHGVALFVGYFMALAVLAVRHKVLTRNTRRHHPKRAGSPAPARVTSGVPSE